MQDFNFSETKKAVYEVRNVTYRDAPLAVHQKEIDTRFRGLVQSFVCFRVTENRLYPEVESGDIMLIDLREDALEDGEFFLTRLSGRVGISKAVRQPNDCWQLLTRLNQKPEPEPYRYDELYRSGAIVGRVVGRALSAQP